MNYIVTTTNITKQYKDTTALNNVSIHIPRGSIYGLVGNNGAGKTTLMRLLLGLQNPTSGQIKIADNIKTGAILETPAVYPYWSAKRNLKYQLSLIKNPKYSVSELLKIVGLKDTRKPLIQYSIGMKQRLGIAQAMLNNPRILILDEPTAGLDPKERVRFRNLISAFSKDRIVILSTHIVSDVEFIAEDIIMMKDGQILHFGKTQEITTEIDGQVWECTVPTSRAEQYSETLNISNLRNIENNCTVLRVISEQSPMENAIKVEPTLEDLYLFYFKGVNE